MNLPPMPDLTLTMSQEFEIAKTMKDCEKAEPEELLLVIETCLKQLCMYKNTVNQLIRAWPNGQSEPRSLPAGEDPSMGLHS